MLKNILVLAFVLFTQLLYSQNETISVSEDLQVIKLTDNAYIHISYLEITGSGRFPCNGLVFISNGKAVMIDTPVNDSLAVQLISWFTKNMNISIETVIPTHWHVDCLGGLNGAHQAGLQSYALELTKQLAMEHDYTAPQITFADSLTLQVGEKEIQCYFPGGGHTVDNIVVWIPSEKILYGGCMVRAAQARGLGNTADADLEAWPFTIKNVKEKYSDARIVIPGHGNHGGLELLDHTYDLLMQNTAE